MTKIAFGSCVRLRKDRNGLVKPQLVWDRIAEQAPDYLVLLGDQIYMDYGYKFIASEYIGKPKKYSVEQFSQIMQAKYEQQWGVANFRALLDEVRAKGGLLGTWDDHDFVWNNGYGMEPEASDDGLQNDIYNLEIKKNISRDFFHQFMNCSTNQSELYCYKDTEFARIIVLDNRYYATSHRNTNPQLLGAEQMKFLQEKLAHGLDYTIICGGLTLTSGGERWSKYHREYREFLEFVRDKKVIYLGGDIHRNKFNIINDNGALPLYEIASSGMSLDWGVIPFSNLDYSEKWGLLDINQDLIKVTLYTKGGLSRNKVIEIDVDSWKCIN